jgi:hypothetical protein
VMCCVGFAPKMTLCNQDIIFYFICNLYLTRQVSQEQILIYNDGLPWPNLDSAGPVVHRPMGLPITARCDAAWIQTRDCSDASCAEMQCLRPLRHSGAQHKVHFFATFVAVLLKCLISNRKHIFEMFILYKLPSIQSIILVNIVELLQCF